MLEIAKLQLRKNRLIFVGMALTIAGSIPFSGAIALINGHPVFYGVDSALYFWSFIGLPFVAVLLGSSSGAANAADPLISAEELLPVSNRDAVFAAVGASILHIAALAGLFLVLAFLVSAQWRHSLVIMVPHSASWLKAAEEPIVRPLFWISVFALPLFTAASYCLAYWTRNGIVGGSLALAAVGITVVGLAAGMAMQMFQPYRAPFAGKAGLIFIGSAAAILWALSDSARWFGRNENRRWTRGLLLAGAVAFGATASSMALAMNWSRVNSGASIVDTTPHRWYWSNRQGHEALGSTAARRAAVAGVLLKTLKGGVEFVLPDGERRVLVPAVGRSLLSGVAGDAFGGVRSAVWDKYGKLWVLRAVPGLEGRGTQYHWWYGDAGDTLKFHSPAAGTWWRPFATIGDEVGFVSWSSKYREFMRVDVNLPKLSWQSMGSDEPLFIRNEMLRQRNAGRLSKDGQAFSAILPDGTKQEWRLPAPAVVPERNEGVRILVRALDRSFYAISVRRPGAVGSIAILELDGSVRTVWEGNDAGWPSGHATRRGGLYSVVGASLYAMTAEGDFVSKTNFSPTFQRLSKSGIKHGRAYEILRIDSDRVVVLLYSGSLLTIRVGDGKILSTVDLPESGLLADYFRPHEKRSALFIEELGWETSETGLFWHTGNRLHFVDWNGTIRDLGKA